MSVLVKDMKMPETCEDCQFHCYHSHGEYVCVATPMFYPMNLANSKGIRKDWCPLVALPEKHGRLIDADTIMEQWGLDKATKYRNETAEQQHFSYSTMMMYEIADILDDAPVVIEAEGEG